MSKKKVGTKSTKGGERPGAGRPASGVTKAKISVSVDKLAWEKALKKWGGKGSRLVEKLVLDYTNM